MFTHVIEDKERSRLHSIGKLEILDTPPEESYQKIVTRCATALDAFGGAIAFVDQNRVWYKASIGLNEKEVNREDAICNLTIERGTPLVLNDTSYDERTKNCAHVIGEPHIRAYVGIPLMLTSGDRVGTVSVFDTKPRKFMPNQVILMQRIADIIVRKIELRGSIRQLFWEVDNWLQTDSFN